MEWRLGCRWCAGGSKLGTSLRPHAGQEAGVASSLIFQLRSGGGEGENSPIFLTVPILTIAPWKGGKQP